MHPHTFYATLFEQQKRDEVFVIMSFAPEFNDRWERIIEPCIREDLGLRPNRVDDNQSGESIVTDILDGIAHAKLVLAEITSSAMRDTLGRDWPQRNGNVMWELGIAHLTRLPDEVLVIRSDNDRSIFDLTQFRAFNYDPDDVPTSRQFLKDLATDRLRAVEQAATVHVERCAASLDYSAFLVLSLAGDDGLSPPLSATIGQAIGNMAMISAIGRLLEMGALRTSFTLVTPEVVQSLGDGPAESLVRYRITPFGLAILRHCAQQMGTLSPEMQPLLQHLFQDRDRAERRTTVRP